MKKLFNKIFCMFLIIFLLFSSLLNVSFASENDDYRYITQIDLNGDNIAKPKANFTVTIKKPDGSIRGSIQPSTSNSLAYDEFGTPLNLSTIKKITAYVGDTLIVTDNSSSGSGTRVIDCDFKWYCGEGSGSYFGSISELQGEGKKFTLIKSGNWELYYNVKDNYEPFQIMPNWSENGCHVTRDYTNPDFLPGGMLWYYTRVDVEVKELEIKPEFKITYNGTDVTNKKFEIDSFPCTVTLTDTSTTDNGGTIKSRQWQAFSNAELSYKNIGSAASITYTINEDEVTNASKSFLLTLNGNNDISVNHYCWPYFEEEPEDPEPPDDNNPPMVMLNAPKTVKAGADFSVSAFGSDPDGDKLSYIWETNNAEGKPSGTWGSLWYPIEYSNTTQTVAVIVNDGQYDGWDSADIIVTEPTVDAKITTSGSLKENRKVTISDASDCPKHYPITNRSWIIEPVDTSGGLTIEDIKHDGDSSAQTKDVLFKTAGRYKVTLNVTNAAGYSDVAIIFITIAPDKAPVGKITAPTTVYRDAKDDGYAAIELTDKSYSNDNDFIQQRVWKYRYDADNDGQFYDEHWVTLDSGNLVTYIFKTKDVGKYQIQVDVKESFGQETILEFITESDYKKSSSEIITVEVANLAPVANFELTKKKQADFLFNIVNSKYTINDVLSFTNTHLVPTLNANNYDYKIDVINNFDYTKTDLLGMYRDYSEKYFITISDMIDLRPQIPSGPFRISLYDNNRSNTKTLDYFTLNPKTKRYEWISDLKSNNSAISVLSAGTSGGTGSASLYAEDVDGNRISVLDVISYRYAEVISINGINIFRNHHSDIYWNADIDTFIHNLSISGTTLEITLSANASWLVLDPKGGSHNAEYRQLSKVTKSCDLSSLNFDNDIKLFFSYGASENSYGEDGFGRVNFYGDLTKYQDNNEIISRFTNGDSEILKPFITNNIKFIGFGNDTDKHLYESFIDSINGNGFYRKNTDLAGAITALANHMNKPDGYYDIADYVVLNEPIDTNIIYDDAENDPMLEKRYKYTHTDPDYFDNSLGLMPDTGYISKSKLFFDKVGKFLINVGVRDNPKEDTLFDNYKLWSMEKSRPIIAHRRPIADFSLTVRPGVGENYIPVITDASYDLDHTSRTDKGIVSREWSWKNTTSTEWNSGIPTEFIRGSKYMVQLKVRDMEGAWSAPVIKTLDANNINLPPYVDADPQAADSDTEIAVAVTAEDYGENDFSHTNYYWSKYTTKPGASSGWTTKNAKTFTTVLETEGIWYLHMEAFDTSGQSFYICRGPYKYFKNRPPTVNIIGVSPGVAYEGDDITVQVQPNDTDNDDLTVDMVLYKDGVQVWTKSIIVSAAAGGGYNPVSQVVQTNAEPGSYRFAITVKDPLGMSASADTSYFVSTLGITGSVRHTDLWDSHRQKYNISKSGNHDSPRQYSVFFPGERFMLSADTSAIDASRPDLYAQSVTCVLQDTSYSNSMSSSNKIRWDGDIWDESMIRWGSRALTFRFTVTYSNGAVKAYDVPVSIADDEYWRLHMYF